MTPRLIAIDMDGTLLNSAGIVSPRNLAALRLAQSCAAEVVIATGRRHCYAMRVLRDLNLHPDSAVVSSNGAVIRTIGSHLLHRTHMSLATALWLCEHISDFRSSLMLTFDKVGPTGEDTRGALVCEQMEDLNLSISRWMKANEPYIARISPIEDALRAVGENPEPEPPIQMMLCGTIDRMSQAEARLLEHPRVSPVGSPERLGAEIALHRTAYPEKDLSIVDILPAGCSKASALVQLARLRGISTRDILAIGDNWNDLPMLHLAGRAVLMSNAPADLLSIAYEKGWRIAPSNDEDGVALAIEAALEPALAWTGS